MKLKHVRHATSLLDYAGIKLLIDPVLADVVLSTHVHLDHFDTHAIELLAKNTPILGQPTDAEFFANNGFNAYKPVEQTTTYKDIEITRVNAQHGTGEIGKLMGHASGYILKAAEEPTLYITGDTIYNDSIKANMEAHKPDVLLMNAGSPIFLEGDRIVMNIEDIEATMAVNASLTFILVHLDTFNHCIETRAVLRDNFTPERLAHLGVRTEAFIIPEDDQVI